MLPLNFRDVLTTESKKKVGRSPLRDQRQQSQPIPLSAKMLAGLCSDTTEIDL